MFDYVDFLVDTSKEYLTGYFYKRRPKDVTDGKITFKYEQGNPNAKVFQTVLGGVRADSETYALKTNDHCGFNIGGYIITQNGKIWQITEVVSNEQANGSNEVLRWFKTAKNAECNVRLLRVDNLFTEETYTDDCVATIDFETTILSATVFENTNSEPTSYPYTLNDNILTFFLPQGTSAIVTLIYDGGTKTIEIAKKQTLKDKLYIQESV